MSQKIEWVIHVWGMKRDTLKLNPIEEYHLDMLRKYRKQQKRFDRILVNIALDDVEDMKLFDFLKEKICDALPYDNVEFAYCQNEKSKGEYVTFRPYVFNRIGEDVCIFYSHFKGYATHININRESFPLRIIHLNQMFWSYLMYAYSMNIDDVLDKLKDKCTYSWFVLKNDSEKRNMSYYDSYMDCLYMGDEKFKDYVEDNLRKHSPGSFVWYNMKNLGNVFKDKPLVTSVKDDFLVKNTVDGKANLCGHFCELYVMPFLKESDCYSVNDFNEAVNEMENTMYSGVYSYKKIGREHLKEFEKYLIDHKII